MAIELETERLRFRQWREGDVEALYVFHNDPVTKAVYGVEFTRAEIWRRVAMFSGHWQMRGFGPLALEEKETGSFAGYCGLWFPESWEDIEIGYGIAPEHRRKGYAVEAIRRVRDHGYHERGIKRLVSYIAPANLASQAVAKKLGAIPDGEFMMHGKPHTIYLHQKL